MEGLSDKAHAVKILEEIAVLKELHGANVFEVRAFQNGARALESLRGIPVKMISLGRSGLNLSLVVDDSQADEAVRAIHHALFEALSQPGVPV